MAKSKYETIVVPNLDKIEAWVRNGVSDKNIAKNLNIAYSTFREYVKKYPALSAIIKKNKEIADNEVENALFQKATGIKEFVPTPVKTKHIEFNKDGKKIREWEEVELVDQLVYIPPDTAAMCFWLKNRRKDQWKDNPNKVDIDKAILEIKKKEFERDDY